MLGVGNTRMQPLILAMPLLYSHVQKQCRSNEKISPLWLETVALFQVLMCFLMLQFKDKIVTVLNFTALLIEHSYARHIYNSTEVGLYPLTHIRYHTHIMVSRVIHLVHTHAPQISHHTHYTLHSITYHTHHIRHQGSYRIFCWGRGGGRREGGRVMGMLYTRLGRVCPMPKLGLRWRVWVGVSVSSIFLREKHTLSFLPKKS